ncbi:hypothetical protein PZ61_0238100 [Streptomyces sp. MNU77]|uniref:hypothetical protein n=1 Tax=Streptomyces sp. MNU77 TaxID=1573406 RepID=UPI0005E60ED6|nr:hypothetical protein [Streptomyces sp. MNU77]OLO25495.1 hypothetical protein PZ61_0238100 [Streptomyces sp. MNU77]
MPRKRPGRVRTRNTNRRAPLLLSTMAPQDYNVRPGETKSIACPDCRTWRRIMGDTVLKIREHPVSDEQGAKSTTCPGSDQLVVVNIDVRRWQVKQDRLLRDAMPQDNRRAAQQFYKPLPAAAVPVARIKGEVTLETTRQSYLAHRKGCTRCVGGQHCTDGGILGRRYVRALQEEPARREAREQLERKARRTERERTAPSVRTAQWAKYGGLTVETANNRCTPRLPETRSEFSGPQLPLSPNDEAAHDQRQAELGKQYAARTSA